MKMNKTYIFAAATALVVLGVYIFDYKANETKTKAQNAIILDKDLNQISYIQIVKPDIKIGLQKNEKGWSLLEPIQDVADNDNIEELIKILSTEKQISVVKESEAPITEIELREFGLDKPSIIFYLKDNLGHTKKVSVGSIKNFEGNSYVRLDDSNKIIIASPVWIAKSENQIIYYREKKLFRSSLVNINKINIKSVRDEFSLKKVGDKWTDTIYGYELDQNKVRDILKKVSETNISEYIFEGEPSTKLVREKGLDKPQVSLRLQSDEIDWEVGFNLHTQDKAVYALTERPTFLVKVDSEAWLSFGNLLLDELRDRSSPLSFNLSEVKKIYFKENEKELKLVYSGGNWKPEGDTPASTVLNDASITKALNHAHSLKISEFIDDSAKQEKFEGQNMLILKSDKEKLVLQLNWGPSFKEKKSGTEKEYYYARTHLSNKIFALEKNLVDSLNLVNAPAAEQETTQEKKSEATVE